MSTWSPSSHPISDIRDWRNNGRLELRPDFQRRLVWSDAARVMLIDTIIKKIPMPKILVASILVDGNTHRIVIDGQQRTQTILDFLSDEYELKTPYKGEFIGLKFSELPKNIQSSILQYSIDYNEVIDFDDQELREVYSRFNKYTFALNKQELRTADYPGNFLEAAQELAMNDDLADINIFSIANRRRMGDVEFSSELIAGLIGGPQDKKSRLDDFYLKYMEWPEDDRQKINDRINVILQDIKYIFEEESFPISKTRFRQKADFYSLFLAIDYFHTYNFSIIGKDISYLKQDLEILDYHVSPSSYIKDLKAYAERCLSDSNSINSRKWRIIFISSILAGTYMGVPPVSKSAELFIRIKHDLALGDSMFDCPTEFVMCPYCGVEEEFSQIDGNFLIAWPLSETSFQLSNSEWVHANCNNGKNEWLAIDDMFIKNIDMKYLELDFNFGNKEFKF